MPAEPDDAATIMVDDIRAVRGESEKPSTVAAPTTTPRILALSLRLVIFSDAARCTCTRRQGIVNGVLRGELSRLPNRGQGTGCTASVSSVIVHIHRTTRK